MRTLQKLNTIFHGIQQMVKDDFQIMGMGNAIAACPEYFNWEQHNHDMLIILAVVKEPENILKVPVEHRDPLLIQYVMETQPEVFETNFQPKKRLTDEQYSKIIVKNMHNL